jgi:hypothetical protein
MKLLCPACGTTVPAADGGNATCPKCNAAVPVPAGYVPGVATPPAPGIQWTADRPAPPPGFVPPNTEKPAADAKSASEAESGLRSFKVEIPDWLLGWVVPAGCVLAIVLACFPWVGSFPGGTRIFSQTGWEAWSGSYSANPIAEAVPELKTADAGLKAAIRSSALLWLYFPLLLLLAAGVAADKLISNPNSTTLPGPIAWLPKVWPIRHRLIAIFSTALLAIVVLEYVRGFGLESAVTTMTLPKPDAEAKAPETDNAKIIQNVKAGLDAARFAVQSTTAFTGFFLIHLLMVLAAGYRAWRGTERSPGIEWTV